MARPKKVRKINSKMRTDLRPLAMFCRASTQIYFYFDVTREKMYEVTQWIELTDEGRT